MPVIGSYVGGDTVAGILATGLAEMEGPSLLMNVGTNGEIVLWPTGSLSAASTAAGPPSRVQEFRVACAARPARSRKWSSILPSPLAGEEVRPTDLTAYHINVIGGVPPVGLCGSGLIDVVAELLRHGLLTPHGRLGVR